MKGRIVMKDERKEAQIRAAIAYAGLSQRKVAEKLGTTAANFNLKLKRSTFSDAELAAIAEVLGCRFIPAAFEFPDGTRM